MKVPFQIHYIYRDFTLFGTESKLKLHSLFVFDHQNVFLFLYIISSSKVRCRLYDLNKLLTEEKETVVSEYVKIFL